MPVMRSTTFDSTTAARLIVCERTGAWAVALRRELAALGVRVWETRSAAGCRVELLEHPASFVLLQAFGDVVETLRCVARWTREFPPRGSPWRPRALRPALSG